MHRSPRAPLVHHRARARLLCAGRRRHRFGDSRGATPVPDSSQRIRCAGRARHVGDYGVHRDPDGPGQQFHQLRIHHQRQDDPGRPQGISVQLPARPQTDRDPDHPSDHRQRRRQYHGHPARLHHRRCRSGIGRFQAAHAARQIRDLGRRVRRARFHLLFQGQLGATPAPPADRGSSRFRGARSGDRKRPRYGNARWKGVSDHQSPPYSHSAESRTLSFGARHPELPCRRWLSRPTGSLFRSSAGSELPELRDPLQPIGTHRAGAAHPGTPPRLLRPCRLLQDHQHRFAHHRQRR